MKLIKLKLVPGYDGYYAVSEKGEVYSRDRLIELPERNNRWIEGIELKQKSNKQRYRTVVLSKNSKKKTEYVHRLVAHAFIDNPDNLPYVHHKDGNPGNNCVVNLQWVSHAQNVQFGYADKLNSNQGGTHSLAVGVIDNELGMKFETIKEWADARGVRYSTARNVLNGYGTTRKVNLDMIKKIRKNEKDDGASKS